MKLETASITSAYLEHIRRKILLLMVLIAMVFIVAVYAVTQGTYEIPIKDVLLALTGNAEGAFRVVRSPACVYNLC